VKAAQVGNKTLAALMVAQYLRLDVLSEKAMLSLTRHQFGKAL